MKSRLLGVVYAFLFLSYSVAAQAATVAFNYSGTITSSTNPSAISVGTPFAGLISYEDDLSGVSAPGPAGTVYAPVEMFLNIGGQSITLISPTLGVINDDPTDPFNTGLPADDWASFLDPHDYIISGLVSSSIELTFVDTDGDAISDESLLTSFDSFPQKTFSIQFANGDRVLGSALISPVPIPAAVWLFSSGLLGLVGISQRRKSS